MHHEVVYTVQLCQGCTESWEETVGRISRDAERISNEADTLRGDQRADGIARLRRMLIAYALHDGEVGYCQGMADLAVPFLELYRADDEMVRWQLSTFQYTQKLADLRKAGDVKRPSSPCCECTRRKERPQQPPPQAHEAGAAVARVDLCLYVVAAALLQHRKSLLACRSMEEVVQFVNRFPPPTDVIALVRAAERIYRKCKGRNGRDRKRLAAVLMLNYTAHRFIMISTPTFMSRPRQHAHQVKEAATQYGWAKPGFLALFVLSLCALFMIQENMPPAADNSFLMESKFTKEAGLAPQLVHRNLSTPQLYEHALSFEPGTHITSTGALATRS
ncbi:hypothetical protein VOLCADRAFT_91998, partial [Volvox carteri f. nagariensis]